MWLPPLSCWSQEAAIILGPCLTPTQKHQEILSTLPSNKHIQNPLISPPPPSPPSKNLQPEEPCEHLHPIPFLCCSEPSLWLRPHHLVSYHFSSHTAPHCSCSTRLTAISVSPTSSPPSWTVLLPADSFILPDLCLRWDLLRASPKPRQSLSAVSFHSLLSINDDNLSPCTSNVPV